MELTYTEDGIQVNRHEFPHDDYFDDDELIEEIIELCDEWDVDVSLDEIQELLSDEIVWLGERTYLRLDK